MGNEWVERNVEEVANVFGGGTPSTKDEANFNGEIPWITPKDLSGYPFRYISRGERNISKKGLNCSNAKLLPVGTVLLTTRAPVGYVAIAANPVTTNQGFHSLVPHNGYSSEFIYYLLKANAEYLKSNASGTTFGELSGSTLKRLKFVFPSIPEQRAIADVLGSLDDKIELNRRMNATLESMARAVFKAWFVDSEEAKGWKVGILEELADLNPEAWSNKSAPSQVEYIDLSNTKWGTIEETIIYSWKDAPSRARRILRPGDTILGTVRPGNGSYALITRKGLTGSTGFAVLRPKSVAYREYVYLATTSKENIEWFAHLADGAAYPAIRPEIVISSEIARPPDEILEKFSTIAKPLMDKIASNDEQSRTLAALRDALLPRLMRGEVRIAPS